MIDKYAVVSVFVVFVAVKVIRPLSLVAYSIDSWCLAVRHGMRAARQKPKVSIKCSPINVSPPRSNCPKELLIGCKRKMIAVPEIRIDVPNTQGVVPNPDRASANIIGTPIIATPIKEKYRVQMLVVMNVSTITDQYWSVGTFHLYSASSGEI